MSIESNISGPKDYSILGPTSVHEGDKKTKTTDKSSQSTISESQIETMMSLYAMNSPVLIPPSGNNNGPSIDTSNAAAIQAMEASSIAQIGSNIWDHYLDALAEEKKRIVDELKSTSYIDREEAKKPVEMHANQTKIDGISNYISNVHDSNPQAANFMAVSTVISSAFIGNVMPVPDVVSTNLVGVNPIQDAVSSVQSVIPPNFQDIANLTINLFAIGALYTSSTELVPKVVTNGPDKNWDLTQAKAYAGEIIDKVKGNEINYFLMNLLVNSTEKGEPLTNEKINKLAATVKLTMLAVALAVLYKVETGWIKGQDFLPLVNGEMQPRSKEEANLVAMFQQIKDSDVLDPVAWDNTMNSLAAFFNSNPSIDDMLDPAKVFVSVNAQVTLADPQA